MNKIIGESKSIKEVLDLVAKVAPSDSSVLIFGENGTGKELVAKAIHKNSKREDKPFVIQNCSSFNDNLLDSELFGHVKGSFTGAIRDKKGLFEVADGGTFFLDEVGDMSPSLQVKVLRILQEGTFMSVGGTKEKKVDVRIIAATNRDLVKMVKEGTFREDLYYRLNVIHITVPAIRDRRSDIPVLTDHFLAQHIKKLKYDKRISPDVVERLTCYSWPGNVRELQNEIERMVVLSGKREEILPEDMSERFQGEGFQAENYDGPDLERFKHYKDLRTALSALEREMIHEGLKRFDWNKSTLARELGISRVSLIKKVEKYSLDRRQIARR